MAFFNTGPQRRADMLERDRSAVHEENTWNWTHNQQKMEHKQTHDHF